MTRQKFKKMTVAFMIRIAEHEGSKVDGKALRKIRDAKPGDYSQPLDEFGSYKATWDWMKPARNAFEMD